MSQLIRHHREDVLRDWAAQVRRLAHYRSNAELRDHLPLFLDKLADELDKPNGHGDVDEPAARHASDRLHEGFELAHVLAEYRVLRRCLVRLAYGRDVRPAAFERMHELIDDAIAEATEQYTVERKGMLRESEERMLTIVDNAPALIFVKDRECRYSLVNRRFEQVFGRPRDEWLGRTDQEVLPAELAEVCGASDRQVLESGAAVEIEESMPSEGVTRTWLVHKFPLRAAEGAVVAICGIATEITRRKEDEALRERFIAVLGHDLRGPLQGISTVLGIAATIQELDPKIRKMISAGERQVGQMSRMINDLLDFARRRLGDGISLSPSVLDMGEVCRDVVRNFTAMHPHRHIETTIAGGLSGHWDRDRLVQALENVVSNAIEHGEDPVRVDVHAEGNDTVVIDVSNNGPPIPADIMPVLFKPFRGRRNGGGRQSGLGLGLYIVEMIVKAHDGHIDVRSSAETGTVVTIRMPRNFVPRGVEAHINGAGGARVLSELVVPLANA